MAERLFLHVGLPKSGTTYLQAVLAENKQRLRDRARVLYPGASWEDRPYELVFGAPAAAPAPGTGGVVGSLTPGQ